MEASFYGKKHCYFAPVFAVRVEVMSSGLLQNKPKKLEPRCDSEPTYTGLDLYILVFQPFIQFVCLQCQKMAADMLF